MLNARMSSILRELMAAKETITSEYLSNIIQVTSRTIRNDIKVLDTLISKHGAEIKSVRGTGYELKIQDEQAFRHLLMEVSKDASKEQGAIPAFPEDRVQYLIKRLLLTEGYVKLEELADELYISKSTIQNDLREVKKILHSYGVGLEKRPNYGLKLKGDELKLRFCMSECIFNRRETELDMVNNRIVILPQEEMLAIRKVILEQIKENGIPLSDIGLNNLIIHIAIACKRIRNENYVSMYPQELDYVIKQKAYEVASTVVAKIEETLKVAFRQTEIAYIAIHLMGTRMIVNPNIGEREIQSFIDSDIYELTMKILDTIESKLKLGIKEDKELIVSISLHLKPAINRYHYGMNLRNPMLDAIKANYPIAFEAGILAGIVLKEEIGFEIHENEIAYLALHIGAAMERSKVSNQLKRCIIVCASGVGSANLLYYKLQSKFGSRLEIAGTSEFYKIKELSFETIDFVISTIPISDSLPVPVIEVNTILGGTDFLKIESALGENTHQTFEYTKEELVFLQKNFETKEEVLFFLGERLQALGLVGDRFIDSVFKREALSPTCYGNFVAIPHPMIPETEHTFWTVCTLQKPILWEDKRVQFVCLLCVEKNSTADLQKMYKLLGSVVDDINLVQQLLKCKTYNEFINIFLKKNKKPC